MSGGDCSTIRQEQCDEKIYTGTIPLDSNFERRIMRRTIQRESVDERLVAACPPRDLATY
jgi:hypothetical protein